MKSQIYRALSVVFFGVFTAPIVSVIWFAAPWLWLRKLPVGADSPHTIGLPLGFCIGAVIAVALNRRYSWGRTGAVIGGSFLGLFVICSLGAYAKARDIEGLDGLGWLVVLLACLYAAVSALGLTLAGVFSHLGRRCTFSQVPAPTD